jgi:RNA polymerase sigma factor (sigma-70 family)
MNTREQIEQLYASKRDELVKIYSRRAGQDDVEDMVQEAFYRALFYADSFNPKFVSLSNWITSILNNCLKDLQREKMDGAAMHSVDEEPAINDRCPSDVEMEKKILKDIEGRGGETKQILWLYFKMGYKPSEIQRVLSGSLSYIGVVVTRFKIHCQDRYGHLMRD